MSRINRQQARAAGRAAVKDAKASKKGAKASSKTRIPIVAFKIEFDELTERQRRGYELNLRWQHENKIASPWEGGITWWFSKTTPYQVTRSQRNARGTMKIEYRCSCPDFEDVGRLDCKHIFAERLRLGEIAVVGASKKQREEKKARRAPSRNRVCTTGPLAGKQIRTVQKHARQAIPERVPLLVASLKAEAEQTLRRQAAKLVLPGSPDRIEIPKRKQKHQGGRLGAPLTTRAAALLLKVANRKSYEEMQSLYGTFIERGILKLPSPPCPNRLSEWMNDERITPILYHFLHVSARPFVLQEIGAIVDSSKMSQLMNTSALGVDYLGDERDNADWVKCHAIVGVETKVVMDVMFSTMHAHDINFIEPLVERALKTFALKFVLGDKAYLSEKVLTFLWNLGIKAVIPVKKKYWVAEGVDYPEPIMELVEWYDKRQRDFHAVYRFRSGIEGLFSLVKRTADGHCWSRGRQRTNLNPLEPCTAWKNEILCKLIYANLRKTVEKEKEFGPEVDYLAQRPFREPKGGLLLAAV